MSGDVSLAEILGVVLVSSLFSLGGGNGPIAVVQSQWVETGRLDPGLFAWVIALGYLSPGPKAGFLSGLGYYLQGFPGAIAAVLGIIIPACVASASVTHIFGRLRPLIARIRLPASFVIAGMIAAAAWGTAAPMKLTVPELLAVAVVAVLVGWRHVEPLWVVLGAAAIGVLAWLLR